MSTTTLSENTVNLREDVNASHFYGHITPIEGFDWEAHVANDPRALKHSETLGLSEVDCSEYGDTLDDITEPILGSAVKAKIIESNDDHIGIDIGWRELAYIDKSKETYELSNFNIGDGIDVIITEIAKSTKNRNPISASFSVWADYIKKVDIINCIDESGVAYNGYVKGRIDGGYLVDIDGIETFMPGSLGGMNKIVDFDKLIGKEIYVIPISFIKERDCIVVSHRKYLHTLLESEVDNLEVGKEYNGNVTGTAKYGVFVEFNKCLTGLIHKTDLDQETYDRLSNRKIKPGDDITFKLKEISSNTRLILTQKQMASDSDWNMLMSIYANREEINGKVLKKLKYGVLVEIIPGINGVIHESKLNGDTTKGTIIKSRVVNIDTEKKKVMLVPA